MFGCFNRAKTFTYEEKKKFHWLHLLFLVKNPCNAILKNLVHAAWQHKNNFGETHCRKKANSELFSKTANNKLQSPMDLCILVTLTWLKFAWVYSKLFSKSCDYFSKQVLFPLKPEQGHYQYMFWYLVQSSSVQIWTWETLQSDSSENLEAQGFILLQNPTKCF